MIDATVQRLLERVVDSPVKLQLLLMFHDNLWMEWSATQIAARTYCDIWSIRTALSELSEDGVLRSSSVANGEPLYCYQPSADYVDAIAQLYYAYNEPLERGNVQRMVREAASMARYRRSDETYQSSERAPYC